MKICILGPVRTSKYFGGVAVFVQGLADAFLMQGHMVQIITNYAEQERTDNKVPIISVSSSCCRKNPVVPFRIAKKVMVFQPDLIISSLEYGLANRILKYQGFNGIIMHFLHGFPIFNQRIVHNFFINKITKYIANYSDFVIANSEYTSSINESHGLKTDTVMNVCVGYEFLTELKKKYNKVEKKESTVVFVGRLVKEKHVDRLIMAFSKTKLASSLTIVGDGPEKDTLQALAARMDKPIFFVGSVSQGEVVSYYLRSDIFISLCPHESFGIVYLEAMAANCKVICPRSGGHLDFSLDFPDRVTMISTVDAVGIAEAIDTAVQQKISYYDFNYWAHKFSYQELAKNMEGYFLQKTKVEKYGL